MGEEGGCKGDREREREGGRSNTTRLLKKQNRKLLATLEFNRKYIFALIAEGTVKKKRRGEVGVELPIRYKKTEKMNLFHLFQVPLTITAAS